MDRYDLPGKTNLDILKLTKTSIWLNYLLLLHYKTRHDKLPCIDEYSLP